MIQKNEKVVRKKNLLVSVLRSWWVIGFLLCGTVGFYQSVKKKNSELSHIEASLKTLEREKEVLLSEKEELERRIESESDPAWVELVLMKELGVVPEGKTKVHFSQRNIP